MGKIIVLCSLLYLISPLPKYFNSIVVPTLPVEQTRYANSKEICHRKVVKKCLRGDLDSKIISLVIGDSHAAELNYSFDKIGINTGTSFKVITSSGCITIPNFDYKHLPKWDQTPCRKQIKIANKEIHKHNQIILAGKWSDQFKGPTFETELNHFLQKANKAQKRVVIISQAPMLAFNIQRTIRFNHLGLPTNTVYEKRWNEGNKKIKDISEQYSNVVFLDLSRSKFFENAPYYNGNLIYYDRHHLNETGAKLYSSFLEPYFDN